MRPQGPAAVPGLLAACASEAGMRCDAGCLVHTAQHRCLAPHVPQLPGRQCAAGGDVVNHSSSCSAHVWHASQAVVVVCRCQGAKPAGHCVRLHVQGAPKRLVCAPHGASHCVRLCIVMCGRAGAGRSLGAALCQRQMTLQPPHCCAMCCIMPACNDVRCATSAVAQIATPQSLLFPARSCLALSCQGCRPPTCRPPAGLLQLPGDPMCALLRMCRSLRRLPACRA